MELVAWLTELMHCAQPLVAHAGVRLTLRCSLTAHVAAIHPSYLERLLWNLLSNAVKYTPSGGEVTVTLRAAAGQVLLTVADSGVGIPPEQQAHLFDGYLEKLRMPPPPQGLGLGLPLCQAIARGHGGRLLLQSGPEGTTVTVSLPDRRCTKTVLPGAALRLRRRLSSGAAGAGGCAALYGLHPEKSGLTAPHMILGYPALAGKDTRGKRCMEKKRVLVAMSGGVDSSAAALLLQQQGYACDGAMLKLYSGEVEGTCCSADDADDARSVAYRLGMKFYVFNETERFARDVMDHFVAEYCAGHTPNPCIDCNRCLKFGALLERALVLGYDYLATGHYARVGYDPETGLYRLLRGRDRRKDQSYVLYQLTQHQLSHLLLPVGELRQARHPGERP